MQENRNQIVAAVCGLLGQRDRLPAGPVTGCDLLAADGSQRLFYRISFAGSTPVIAVLPSSDQQQGIAESRSAWLIGSHLYHACVPVPEPIACDPDTGLILFEDLGDIRLHDVVLEQGIGAELETYALYREVVRELAHMQIAAMEGFDTSWCWQTPCYDRQLMLERESGYFYQAMCRDLFGLEPDVEGLYLDFIRIADHAAAAPARFFLHRDFQSRNIMVTEGHIRIIDFQGGRLGPLGYDLASLLLDPYVNLPEEIQEKLLADYVLAVQERVACDPDQFRDEYLYLALQRNLQFLGAFAFLGHQRGKSFFLDFIRPGLLSLQRLLAKAGNRHYPVLTRLAQTCLEMRDFQ